MITYMEALNRAGLKLKDAGITEYKTDAWILLSEVCDLSRTSYYMKSDENMPEQMAEEFMEKVERRVKHEPLQYITGHQEFYGIDIKVNPGVLIPRQDTEVLVETVLKCVNGDSDVLDMCTGSGCIICAVAKNGGIKSGTGVDISDIALATSKSNVKYNNIDNVNIIKSDLFKEVSGKYDLIVSNPPYIRTDVIEGLAPEVKDEEPYIALWGHDDGLFFYREITKNAVDFIKSGGWLMYEIGHDQAADVTDIMKENGFTEIEVIKDLAGLDRVVKGRFVFSKKG